MEIKNNLLPMMPMQSPTQAVPGFPKKVKSLTEESEGLAFGQELQQAGVAAKAGAVVEAKVPTNSDQPALPVEVGSAGPAGGEGKVGKQANVQVQVQVQEKSPGYSTLGQKVIPPQTFGLREGPESAERSPLTQNSAASMNTAMAMSGLKPWSKDWVFGEQEGNPALKPLIGGAPKLDPETLAKLVEKLKTGPQQSVAEGGMRGFVLGNEARQAAGAAFAAEVSGDQQTMQVQGQAPLAQLQSQSGSPVIFALPAQALEALQGAEFYGTDTSEDAGAEVNSQPKAQRLNTELSGADFLSTLGVAKAGSRGERSSLSENSQQGDGRRPELKIIDGGAVAGRHFDPSQFDGPSGLAGAQVMNFKPDSVQAGGSKLVAPVVTGHVVKGAMSQDRLSSESLNGMTSSIQDLRMQGGGEMRVRLKPEGLGEMNVRVLTRGNDVRLQIRASDEGAKKIIEESMVHLKDRLATQNLTLGRVELSVGQLLQQQSMGGHEGQADSRQSQYQQWNQNANGQDWNGGTPNQMNQGNNSSQGGSNSERWGEAGSESAGGGTGRGTSSRAALQAMGSAGSARPRAYSETGRLDVTA